MSDALTVEAVNLSKGLALMSDQTFGTVTDMFDDMGSFTDDPAEARACVVKYSENRWFSVLLGDFTRTKLQ